MFIAAFPHNIEKVEAIHMSISWWMNKQKWYIHAMKYYSAIKRNEILTHATTWMNLKSIMLSKRNQTQKVAYCMIPLIWNDQNR